MFCRFIKFLMIPMIREPTIVFRMFPTPPLILVPPTITAVIASISIPSPAAGCPELIRAISRIPARPVQTPPNAQAKNLERFTRIPDASAAAWFPPIAYSDLPIGVHARIRYVMASTRIMITTGNGRNPRYPCPRKLNDAGRLE